MRLTLHCAAVAAGDACPSATVKGAVVDCWWHRHITWVSCLEGSSTEARAGATAVWRLSQRMVCRPTALSGWHALQPVPGCHSELTSG
jgi:hypothetical protein